MKLKFYILILVIIGILLVVSLFYFYWFKGEVQIQEIEKQNLVISQYSIQGMLIATYLFEDRTFLKINEFRIEELRSNCYEGEISSDEYNSFIQFVKSKGFFDIKITQGDDFGLLCEERYMVEVNIDNKSNLLSLPCVAEDTESTKKAELIMRDISKELDRITNTSKQICRQGGFIKTSDLGSCSKLVSQHRQWYDEELKYETYNFSDLDPALKKSLIYKGAYVYVGPIDETIESHHRKYYRIDDSCYFVLLSEFDGNLFRSYDDVLREKE